MHDWRPGVQPRSPMGKFCCPCLPWGSPGEREGATRDKSTQTRGWPGQNGLNHHKRCSSVKLPMGLYDVVRWINCLQKRGCLCPKASLAWEERNNGQQHGGPTTGKSQCQKDKCVTVTKCSDVSKINVEVLWTSRLARQEGELPRL